MGNIFNTNSFITPIEFLKGVGPDRAVLLRKELEIFTFGDLIKYFPYRYIDRSKFYSIRDAVDANAFIQMKGNISKVQIVGLGRAKRLTALFTDETGSVELVWFNGIKWVEELLVHKEPFVVFGKVSIFNQKANITHPEIEVLSSFQNKANSGFRALYNTSDKMKTRGLDSKGMAKLIHALFIQLTEEQFYENLPQNLLENYRLWSRYLALKKIHFPDNIEDQQNAIRRLKFEELFLIQLGMIKNKLIRKKENGILFGPLAEKFNGFYNNFLPFNLTNAQKRVLKEIRKDTLSGSQMNRLLQGDVGSGKTIVALLSILMAIDSGFQALLMAPTEILAKQHYDDISKMMSFIGVKVAFLTGSVKGKARTEILHQLKEGEINLIIGTHALIEDTVQFLKLGLVVIDEQHRFGVAQRAKLWLKNELPPHVLVMTATPIPRTLAMTLYGDLDVSILDELPPGRKPITTIHKTEAHRLHVLGFMKEQIRLGRQIYIVYPLIVESEKMDMKNLMDGFEQISNTFPLPEYKICIVHGKMKPSEKEAEMDRFVRNETQIMVATTVIEVGVNVPNASVMIIENSERFGLSQLHQLRGRVGRGAEQSFCILMTGNKLTQEGKKRVKTMVETNDGFKISEVDLEIRGPGELQGTRQSGGLNLKIANLITDVKILEEARKAAFLLLEEDLLLEKPINFGLKRYLNAETNEKNNWGKIS
jgi:ATP-dependent DNA helicase RecG